MVALSLQTLLLMGGAYLLGAIVACAARRALHRAPAQSAATAERRVDPLPEMVQGGPARLVQPATETRPPVPETAPVKPATPTATPAQPAQDLTRIRGIDAALADALGKLGITRYEQIAAWMRSDIERIEPTLGQPGRANRENWIEQAQILAKGGETRYASRRARGETANAEPTPDRGRAPSVAAIVQAAATATAPLRAPITVTARPATAAPQPSPPRSSRPNSRRRPSASRNPPPRRGPRPHRFLPMWQAAPRSRSLAPSRRPPRSPLQMPPPSRQLLPMRPRSRPCRSVRQRRRLATTCSASAASMPRPSSVSPPRPSPAIRRSLTGRPSDVERFERLLGTSRRIARENWIEQAQILSRGGDTAFSREFDRREAEAAAQLRPAKLSDAIREHSAAKSGETKSPSQPQPKSSEPKSGEEVRNTPRPISARCDRSARRPTRRAEPGPEAARRVASLTKVVRSANLEDLKRIRGIGVLIEKKLNSMGVVSYEQIANWSGQDIDRVSQSLDFKGRIERENWVEQARILASGGATEFSRRMDRGEIETSRTRS